MDGGGGRTCSKRALVMQVDRVFQKSSKKNVRHGDIDSEASLGKVHHSGS